MFASAGVDLGAPLVASCGSGVTASVLALALEQLTPKPKVLCSLHTAACLRLHARVSVSVPVPVPVLQPIDINLYWATRL